MTLRWAEMDEASRHKALSRPALSRSEDVLATVRAIRTDVLERGDEALFDYAERFDEARISRLEVTPEEISLAIAAVDPEDRKCLTHAARNIERFHRDSGSPFREVETEPGVFCRRETRPLDSVGLYVPGGKAPLVSTLLMLAIPARLAGCVHRYVCTPPGRDGLVPAPILAAAELCGVEAVFKVGGAQAVAAMAIGTRSIPRVDKIFGPGNMYVTAAKQLVSSEPGGPPVDLPAGPSEVLVIADATARAEFVAADLLSQAEHDEAAQVLLVTPSEPFAREVARELSDQLSDLPRRLVAESSLNSARFLIVRDLGEAIEVSNRYAPEHLILNCEDADSLVRDVRHAGSVFVGPWAAEAMGDYASGTNHVLPTYGGARAYSGLSLDSFRKTMTVQRLTESGLDTLGPVVERLARLEGLEGHARAVSKRRAEIARRGASA